MQNLTLDHNCIIDLEECEGQHEALRQLLALHEAGNLCVHVGKVSAQENVRGGEPSFAAFTDRIERLGLTHLPQLAPEWRFGMSYFGHCVLGGDDGLSDRVQAIIHPQFTIETSPNDRTRRNRFCDIDALVAHIRRNHDVFVTRDPHFLRKREALIELGAGNILTPEETVTFVEMS